ncbi:MAG TPA: hypothetical protein VFB28_10010 [Terriglobales bacterium]|jgi:hypothetical protein|nr:hypothetical protein [Terriglobales bacterium]
MNFLSKLLQTIGFVPSIVSSIEALFGRRPGTEKKDAVMSFLQSALSMADAVAANEIKDETAFRNGLSQIITGTVACLNASVWAKAQEPAQPTSITAPATAK